MSPPHHQGGRRSPTRNETSSPSEKRQNSTHSPPPPPVDLLDTYNPLLEAGSADCDVLGDIFSNSNSNHNNSSSTNSEFEVDEFFLGFFPINELVAAVW